MENFKLGPAGLNDDKAAKLIFMPVKLGQEFKLVVLLAGPAGIRDRDMAADEILDADRQKVHAFDIR